MHESYTWLSLIYRRLSARQRIKNPWVLEFTRDIPKELYSAIMRAFSTTTNRDVMRNVHMDGNSKGFAISIGYLPSVLYMFGILSPKTVGQLKGFLNRRIAGKGKAKVMLLFHDLSNSHFATSI